MKWIQFSTFLCVCEARNTNYIYGTKKNEYGFEF
jgi:hypothetical protein